MPLTNLEKQASFLLMNTDAPLTKKAEAYIDTLEKKLDDVSKAKDLTYRGKQLDERRLGVGDYAGSAFENFGNFGIGLAGAAGAVGAGHAVMRRNDKELSKDTISKFRSLIQQTPKNGGPNVALSKVLSQHGFGRYTDSRPKNIPTSAMNSPAARSAAAELAKLNKANSPAGLAGVSRPTPAILEAAKRKLNNAVLAGLPQNAALGDVAKQLASATNDKDLGKMLNNSGRGRLTQRIRRFLTSKNDVGNTFAATVNKARSLGKVTGKADLAELAVDFLNTAKHPISQGGKAGGRQAAKVLRSEVLNAKNVLTTPQKHGLKGLGLGGFLAAPIAKTMLFGTGERGRINRELAAIKQRLGSR